MKRIILLIIAVLTVFGCAKESMSPSTAENKNEDIYFVRYAASSAGTSVTYTKEDGNKITVTGASTDNGTFERTVGPVCKGFYCYFSITKNNSDFSEIPLRIEVKRKGEPFVVKVEGKGSISYTVD